MENSNSLKNTNKPVESPKPRQRWDWDTDLEVIKMVFEGLTGEGIGRRMGMPPQRVHNRINALQLGMAEARKVARSSPMTPAQYLATSPWYVEKFESQRRIEERRLQAEREEREKREHEKASVLDPSLENEFNGFYGLLFVEEEFRKKPAFYIYAAQKLEKAARGLRQQAAKMLEDKMSGGKGANGD